MVVAVEAYRIAYMALPKAGCTAVKQALARVDPAVNLPPDDARTVFTWHDTYPTRRFRRSRWLAHRGWFRFCVIRDPIERLMSVYSNRVLGFRDLEKARGLAQAGLPEDPDPNTFFQNLERYRRHSSSIRHHAWGAHMFLGRDWGNYDRVYRIDELDALSWDLTLQCRRPVSFDRVNPSRRKLDFWSLHPMTIDHLRPFLAEEYALMKGFYENPLERRQYGACATL